MSADGWASLLAIVSALGSLWVAVRAQRGCSGLSKQVTEQAKRVTELEALTAAQADALNAFCEDQTRISEPPVESGVKSLVRRQWVVRRMTGVLPRFRIPDE